jgi:hypothetical protein
MTNPLLPLTYPEALCYDDFDPYDRTVASDFEALQQDCYHWLIQTHGSNADELRDPGGPIHGVGIEDMLSGATVDVAAIGPRIEADFLQDDRITACNATVSQQTDGSFLIQIEVEVGAQVLGLAYSYDANAGLTILPSP